MTDSLGDLRGVLDEVGQRLGEALGYAGAARARRIPVTAIPGGAAPARRLIA